MANGNSVTDQPPTPPRVPAATIQKAPISKASISKALTSKTTLSKANLSIISREAPTQISTWLNGIPMEHEPVKSAGATLCNIGQRRSARFSAFPYQQPSRTAYPEHGPSILPGASFRKASRLVKAPGGIDWPTLALAKDLPKGIYKIPYSIYRHICKNYLDHCSRICLALTCRGLYRSTWHVHPSRLSLYSWTMPSRLCLGQLLEDWMAPKYSFDHSRGIFRLKKHYLNNEEDVTRKWREIQSWPDIGITVDSAGAVIAYRKEIEAGDQSILYRL